MEQKIINFTKSATDDLVKLALFSNSKLWVDYDREADVLYVNFGKPQKADSAQQSGNIIKRTKNNKIVGLTILNASSFN